MDIVVQKYGGSSVGDMERLRAVARRVVATAEAGHRVVVVVSAMGGTTDELLELARQASPDPSRRELDLLLSVGERISMTLLAMAIGELGHEAESFTGSQSGIITDESHVAARIIEVRPYRLRQALDAGRIVIVAGYQGVSRAKNVTTLGRGGSDTSAVALAAALGAVRCEICSDVSGVFSADPRSVSEATQIARMTAGEVIALGVAGARVLAASAADEARRRGVLIEARHSFATGPGTVVVTEPVPGRGRALAVASDPHAVQLCWQGDATGLPVVLGRLSALDTALRHLHIDQSGKPVRVTGWLDTRDIHGDELSQLEGEGVRVDRGRVPVTAIGAGIAEQPALVRRALDALSRAGIEALELSSHPFGLMLEVPRDTGAAAVSALHRALIEDLRG